MSRVIQALSRAMYLMFTPRVWLLIWKPAVWSALFWLVVAGVVFYLWGAHLSAWGHSVQNWVDVHVAAGQSSWKTALNGVLAVLAFAIVAIVFVLLTVIWAMVLISVYGMKHISRLVAKKYFPNLPEGAGLSTWQSMWHTLKWTFWFAVFWVISVPAYVLAGLGALVQGGVIARYNQKVFTLDALADYASHEEFESIAAQHNRNLFILGAVVTLLGALPTFVWIGSVVGAILLPITAMLSVLTFTALFTFCGLAYSCYCLQALADLRSAHAALPEHPLSTATPRIKATR